QGDILIGSPVAGRTQAESEGLIGFFINTLVLSVDLSGAPTFQEIVHRTREVTLGAYEHQDVPFEKLVEALKPPRDQSRSPLFQVMFQLQNAPMSDLSLGELTIQSQPFDSAIAKFDLTLSLVETEDGLRGGVEYNTDLFDAQTARRRVGHFETLLGAIAANPEERIGELSLLTTPERQQLLTAWNNTRVKYPVE